VTRTRSHDFTRSKWFMPVFCLVLGLVILGAGWLGGQLVTGLIALAVMASVALVLLVSGRSETMRWLRGDGRDERFAQIDLRATAVTGLVLLVTLIVAWLVQIAGGHSGHPYDWLTAIGGLAYLLTIVFLRWRG
jgi:cobalamin synthase